MGIENTNERGHFLDEQQKELKQKMMEDLLDGILINFNKNKDILTLQSAMDLIFSVLLMFNREILVHVISLFGLEANRKQLMKDLFEQIRHQVNERIKQTMQ